MIILSWRTCSLFEPTSVQSFKWLFPIWNTIQIKKVVKFKISDVRSFIFGIAWKLYVAVFWKHLYSETLNLEPTFELWLWRFSYVKKKSGDFCQIHKNFSIWRPYEKRSKSFNKHRSIAPKEPFLSRVCLICSVIESIESWAACSFLNNNLFVLKNFLQI